MLLLNKHYLTGVNTTSNRYPRYNQEYKLLVLDLKRFQFNIKVTDALVIGRNLNKRKEVVKRSLYVRFQGVIFCKRIVILQSPSLNRQCHLGELRRFYGCVKYSLRIEFSINANEYCLVKSSEGDCALLYAHFRLLTT